MDWLLSPPVAFLAYLLLVLVLVGIGRALAGPSKASALKSSVYASGEAPPSRMGQPGYAPFFVAALFFGILHLGVLVIGTTTLAPLAGLYVLGLALALLALVLG